MKFTRKNIILIAAIIILVLFVFIINLISNGSLKLFKNPKTITINDSKSNINISYEDNGDYEVVSGDGITIKNRFDNFKIKFKIKNYTKEQLEMIKQNFLKSNNFTSENVKIGKYRGYLLSNKKNGNSIVYLNADNIENVVLSANVNAVYTDDLKKQIKKGASAEKVVYNLKEVQKILRSIEYKK